MALSGDVHSLPSFKQDRPQHTDLARSVAHPPLRSSLGDRFCLLRQFLEAARYTAYAARDGSAGARTLVFADGERILMPLGEPYRPWRTAATWYMWRALETEMP